MSLSSTPSILIMKLNKRGERKIFLMNNLLDKIEMESKIVGGVGDRKGDIHMNENNFFSVRTVITFAFKPSNCYANFYAPEDFL